MRDIALVRKPWARVLMVALLLAVLALAVVVLGTSEDASAHTVAHHCDVHTSYVYETPHWKHSSYSPGDGTARHYHFQYQTYKGYWLYMHYTSTWCSQY